MTHATRVRLDLADDWTQALRSLWDFGEAESISAEAWGELLDWLLTNDFNDKSFVAGEAAAKLIQERAPDEVRLRFQKLSKDRIDDGTDPFDWLLHFCVVALKPGELRTSSRLIGRAIVSRNLVVSTHARENCSAILESSDRN